MIVSRHGERHDDGNHRAQLTRGTWGLISQGSNMLGNMLASVFVASHASPEGFGAWTIGYSLALAALPVCRALAAQPLVLNTHRLQASDSSGAASAGFWFGLCLSLPMFAVSFFLGPLIAKALLIFSLCLPFFLWQDSLRFVFIARRTPARTAAMDAWWLVAEVIGFVALLWSGHTGFVSITAVWALGALSSCTLCRGTSSLGVHPRNALQFARRNMRAYTSLVPDAVLTGIAGNLLPSILAIVGGLSSTAALRAGQVLFGPVNVLTAGLLPVITTEAVRVLQSGTSVWRVFQGWSLVLGAGGAIFSFIAFAIPDSLGSRLLGASWTLVPLVILPLAIESIIRGPARSGPLVLRARHLLSDALILRVLSSLVVLVCAVIGVMCGRATGAAWGLAAGALINGVLAIVWIQFTKSRVVTDPWSRRDVAEP